jgi:hypothetical protein
MAIVKYRLVCGSNRQSFVSFDDKVRSIADIYIHNKGVKDVLTTLYGTRKLPKNLSTILTNWRKSIQSKLDSGDTYTVELCKRYGVIEESAEDTSPPPANKKSNKKNKKSIKELEEAVVA